jgi:hypothetical protein
LFESLELEAHSKSRKALVWEPHVLHKLHQIISYNLNWKDSSFDLVILIYLINEALIQHKSKPVHGIIGAGRIEGMQIIFLYLQ